MSNDTIVFLDFDGVLNGYELEPQDPSEVPFPANALHPTPVEHLNVIIRETEAKVVVTSTWRKLHDQEDLQSYLEQQGFIGQVIGTTPVLGEREKEIRRILRKKEPERFVVIDDEIREEQFNYLVRTSIHGRGLTEAKARQAIRLLEQQGSPAEG